MIAISNDTKRLVRDFVSVFKAHKNISRIVDAVEQEYAADSIGMFSCIMSIASELHILELDKRFYDVYKPTEDNIEELFLQFLKESDDMIIDISLNDKSTVAEINVTKYLLKHARDRLVDFLQLVKDADIIFYEIDEAYNRLFTPDKINNVIMESMPDSVDDRYRKTIAAFMSNTKIDNIKSAATLDNVVKAISKGDINAFDSIANGVTSYFDHDSVHKALDEDKIDLSTFSIDEFVDSVTADKGARDAVKQLLPTSSIKGSMKVKKRVSKKQADMIKAMVHKTKNRSSSLRNKLKALRMIDDVAYAFSNAIGSDLQVTSRILNRRLRNRAISNIDKFSEWSDKVISSLSECTGKKQAIEVLKSNGVVLSKRDLKQLKA